MIFNSKKLLHLFTVAVVFLSFFILSQKLADSVYARTGTSSNGSGQTLTYTVDDKTWPRGSMGWIATITNNGASTYNTTLTASVPAEVTVAALNGWSQVGSRLYYNMSVAPGASQTANWFGQGVWGEFYKATSSIETNDLSMITSTYVIFYAQLGFVVRNQSSSVQQVLIRVRDGIGALAGTSGTIPLSPGASEIVWLNNADGGIISCDLNPFTIEWSTSTIPWTTANVSVNPINVRNNEVDQVTITIPPTSTPTPTNTPTPTPTTPPGVTPPPTPTPTTAPKTASLSASCPGGTPTLSASWSVGVGSDCNAYIVAGFSSYQISTNCSGSWSGSQLPSGPLIVNGGIYHLYVGDPSPATTDGGEATVVCVPGSTPTPTLPPSGCDGSSTCCWDDCGSHGCGANQSYVYGIGCPAWYVGPGCYNDSNCSSPPGGLTCLECKFSSSVYGDWPPSFMETYEYPGVSGPDICNSNFGGQAYGPGKDQIDQNKADCEWINCCDGDPFSGCSGSWSGTPYGIDRCICGDFTDDHRLNSAISFSNPSPRPGETFTVKVTSFKAYDQRTGDANTQAARRISLVATGPSGTLNFSSPMRSYNTVEAHHWNANNDGGFRNYNVRNWEWDISLPQMGAYGFKFYVGNIGDNWVCRQTSLTITAPPPTCDGVNLAPASINNLIQGDSTSLIVTGIQNPQNYTGVTRVDFAPSGPIVTVNPASDTTSADGFKTTVTAQSVGSGNITATAYITGPGGTGSCSGIVPVTVIPPPPWLQTQGGDVHVQGGLTDITPLSNYFSLVDGTYPQPGVVSAYGSTYFTPGSVSTLGWLLSGATTGDYPFDTGYDPVSKRLYDYDYFIKKVFTEDLPAANPNAPTANELRDLTTDKFYKVTGDVILPHPFGSTWSVGSGPTKKIITIFIDGNLTIQGKIKVNNGFLALIVNGNITIDPSVFESNVNTAAVTGVYIANGIISTGVSVEPLVVSGVFVAHGGFNLQRDNKNNPDLTKTPSQVPAEKFVYDSNLIMQAPTTLLSTPFIWQEVAP